MKSFVIITILLLNVSVFSHAYPQIDLPKLIKDILNIDDGDDVSERYQTQNNQGSINWDSTDGLPSPVQNQPLGPGCRIEYETKYEIIEEESTKNECREWTENKCTTKQRPKCNSWNERVCNTKYRQKCRNWVETDCKETVRNECTSKTRRECKDQKTPIQVPYQEDECTTKKEKRCEKHWEEPSEGRKVWVDNPATCKFYDTSDCKTVTKYRTETKTSTKCDNVPYQDCHQVKDLKCNDVPKQECKDEPWEDCRDVQRENCVQESFQDCREYPRTECKEVHSKVPKQVTKQVPIRVCGDQQDLPKQQGNCQCDDKIVGGYGNCGKSFSKHGRSGPICYVPRVNACDSSFEGKNGFYSWDPCSSNKDQGEDWGGSLKACRDDSRWRDDKYGDGKDKCKDLTLDWCNNKGKYSIEAREACPKSCGLC